MRTGIWIVLLLNWVVAAAPAANILMTNYSSDLTEVRPLRLPGGGMLEEGGAVVAVGSFSGLADDEIRSLAGSAEGIEELSQRFVMHGNGVESGSGGAIEETGIYGHDASAPIMADAPLAGEAIFTVVSTAGGLLVWKSEVVFPVDVPISMADVAMAEIPVDVLGSQLLVGGIGGVEEVDFFGGGMVTVELAAVDGRFAIPADRIVRLGPGVDEAEDPGAGDPEPEVTVAIEDGGGDVPGDVLPPDDTGAPEIEIEVDPVVEVTEPRIEIDPGWPWGDWDYWGEWSGRFGMLDDVMIVEARAWNQMQATSFSALGGGVGDGVQSWSALPEPGVATLSGLGLVLLWLRRRR